MVECGLDDMGHNGSRFTWYRGDLKKRLDRAVVNIAWRVRFEEASIYHIPNFKSDHIPLWLKFKEASGYSRGKRPFRFLASWMTHDDFPGLVARNWNYQEEWNSNISSLTRVLKDWNKNVFGNIKYKKQRLMNRLDVISRSLSHGWNPFLLYLQDHLWREYEKVLFQEEIMWYQKSRCKWLQFGDKNTNYFHGTTIFRRKRAKGRSSPRF